MLFAPMTTTSNRIPELLQAWSEGDPDAFGDLIPMIVDDVRKLAAHVLSRERPFHTLQPTALVNELYLRLADRRTVRWKNRDHFFASIATMMRQILTDYARKLQAKKRDAKMTHLEGRDLAEVRPQQVLDVHDALEALAADFPRAARLVELKFFVGLRRLEIAQALGIAPATVDRDWRAAKAWLLHVLGYNLPEKKDLDTGSETSPDPKTECRQSTEEDSDSESDSLAADADSDANKRA